MTFPGLKFHTPRDESRPTLGTRQGKFSRMWLGTPFMPWQQHVADVAGELGDDGLPVHSLVLVTGPRQIGKSHFEVTTTAERCLSVPGFRAWYTAQTGGDARDQFLKFADENVADTLLDRVVTTLRGNGHEVMKYPNGSTWRPHPPTPKAMHGKQSRRNGIDEGWAFTEEQGAALLQAISPTQLTQPGAQTFIHSAGGTGDSTWLASLVDRGRAGDPSICYFEIGIPDDADAEDLRVIEAHHPAIGHTITRESLRAMRTQFGSDAAGWARAAGNRWTEVIGGAINLELYRAAKWTTPIPDGSKLGFGAATAADRTETVVAAAALVGSHIVIEILDVITQPWGAASHVASWTESDALAVDSIGPSASLHDALKTDTRANLMDFGTREATAATANLVDALEAGVIKFRPHPSLDAAVKVAVKRGTQDGAFLWARKSAGASIAALEAAGNAAFALGHRPTPIPKPMMRLPGE